MLEFLKKLFRFKRSEIEAKLMPTPECTYGGAGEVEIETWSDDTVSLEASIKHSGIPDGAEIEVYCSGRHVLSMPVTGGYAKQYIDSLAGRPVSRVAVGDEAEFRHEGVTLYRGQFRRD